MQSLQGKKVLITGGSRGIGRATALQLAKEGAKLGLIARREESFTSIREELEKIGATYVTAAADVSNEAKVQEAVQKIEEGLGPIDILINNAAVMKYGKFLELETEIWKRLFETNVMGTVYATKAVLPGMIERNRGDIINISSMSGLYGTKGTSAYSASKFAIIGLSESLMQEVRPHNIRVMVLTPSLVETERVRGKGEERNPEKFTQAEDVAEYIASLLKLEQRTFIKTSAIWGTNPF